MPIRVRNKVERKATGIKGYLRQRELIREVKSIPCLDCGVEYPAYVMDFDHVRGEKKFLIARAPGHVSDDALAAEMAKCDVVCSNCHRERTARRLRDAADALLLGDN